MSSTYTAKFSDKTVSQDSYAVFFCGHIISAPPLPLSAHETPCATLAWACGVSASFPRSIRHSA